MKYSFYYHARIACATLLLASMLNVNLRAHAQTTSSAAQTIDRTRLEIIEDLSESLANDLLDLSIATRDRDEKLTAQFFPAKLTATPFPCRPLEAKTDVKWIGIRAWAANQPGDDKKAAAGNSNSRPNAARQMTKEEFLRDWQTFLSHFSEIEDARFKVKGATFDDSASSVANAKVPTATVGSTGKARVAFYVIGRNREGRREWARGVTNSDVRYAETKRWQFMTFALESFDSMVADTDLFSEVAKPAGVAASIPAYGSPANNGFVWHGAAAADINKDGFIDLFVTSATRNYLYLNNCDGTFRDASDEAGVRMLATGTAPLFVDYDNDGDEDLFISAVGQQILFENRLVPDGKLELRDVSLESGVAVDAIGFSAIAGDVNGDGRMDLYVASYNRYGQVTPDSWFRATNGTPNLLFINQGNGTFREEARKWRVDDSRWSYAAAFADVNGDGRMDLYVANDFGEKAMYINRGDHFVDEAKERGVLDPANGMGVSFGDFNNDGLLDLHTTNMSSTAGNRILARLFPNQSPKDNVLKKLAAGNNLFVNTGDGHFKDVTTDVGGFSGGWAWGGGFIDFDNDGWEDIYTPNGFISGKSMKDT
ncbi:MAG TPA: VCBS repeat-containing protein [Blastocatellia bacterium]|nr:VCBS repeat-containing protein [Blastocatellia bacterium]